MSTVSPSMRPLTKSVLSGSRLHPNTTARVASKNNFFAFIVHTSIVLTWDKNCQQHPSRGRDSRAPPQVGNGRVCVHPQLARASFAHSRAQCCRICLE